MCFAVALVPFDHFPDPVLRIISSFFKCVFYFQKCKTQNKSQMITK